MNKYLHNGLLRGGSLIQIFALGLLAWSSVHAQLPLPQPDIQLIANGQVLSSAEAPDGSVVIGGRFTMINGVARQNIARLKSDGTLDLNWDPGADCNVYALAVDASGAIYAGGCFSTIGGENRYSIAKLAGTGSGMADPTWNPELDSNVTSLALDGNGSIYIGGYFLNIDGQPRNHLAKLSTTGAGNVDADWNPNPTSANYVSIAGLAVDSGGAVYVAGNFQNIGGQARAGLAKLSPDGIGNSDPVWDPNPSSAGYLSLRTIAVDSAGSVYVGGHFQNIGGQPRNNIAKLSGSGLGAADADWNPGSNNVVDAFAFDDSNTVYIGGYFSMIGGQPRSYIAKLSTSGSGAVDPNWHPEADGGVQTVELAGSGLLIVGGYFTQVDSQAHIGLALVSSAGTANLAANAERHGSVYAFAAQPGGGMIVGGDFNHADQESRNNILRLQADGTLDLTWNADANGAVGSLAIDSSGAVLAGGAFFAIGGQSRSGFAKLSGSGTGAADPVWNPSANCSSSLAQLAIDDAGAVYVSGCFSAIGGQWRQRIAKLSGVTGAADPTWNPGVDGQINALAVDETGAVFAGGYFQNIGGQPRSYVAKLSGSGIGAADSSWNATADYVITALTTDGTGSVYAGGFFQSIGGQPRGNLAKLSGTTGAADAIWNPGGCGVSALVLDGTGSLFAGGYCAKKVSTAGAGAGTSWDPQANGEVSALALDPSGNVYLGGNFTTVAGQPRDGLAAVPPNAPPIPTAERQVLLDLYVNTDGDNWTNNTGWNGPVGSECSWYGITCANGHITQISLINNHLVGTLPALAPLTALRILVLQDNQLSGTLPALNSLGALQVFYVGGNQMTGSIPSLNGMTALIYVEFSNNQFGGPIPSLDTLTGLQGLWAWGNQLTGSIPALTNLTSLHYFYVYYNQLTGPLPALPNPNNLHPGGTGLCPNQLSPLVDDPAWDAATGVTPWWSECNSIFANGFD